MKISTRMSRAGDEGCHSQTETTLASDVLLAGKIGKKELKKKGEEAHSLTKAKALHTGLSSPGFYLTDITAVKV